MCHLVARGIYIRWQHLILLFIYIVQLYKEDWGILPMLGCRAVALPSTEQIVRGMRVGSIHLRMCVGMGLSSQLLVCMLDIRLVIYSAVRGANFWKVGMSVASGIKTGIWEKFSWILSIFDTKVCKMVFKGFIAVMRG